MAKQRSVGVAELGLGRLRCESEDGVEVGRCCFHGHLGLSERFWSRPLGGGRDHGVRTAVVPAREVVRRRGAGAAQRASDAHGWKVQAGQQVTS